MSRKYKFIILILLTAIIVTVSLWSDALFRSNQNLSENKQNPTLLSKVIAEKVASSSAQSALENIEPQKVSRVIDGDTIELENGQKVRYIGINTPETVDPRKSVECFGKEASLKNKELVEGKNVRLEKDISERDKYSRLLRYVYVDDIFVNDYLVRQGFAYASTFPPDVKYQDQFQKAQLEAQQQNRGIWSNCQQGSSESNPQTTTSDSNCQIKGNISSSGEKIYHLPSQRYYNQTTIDESKGERWFCTEDEAIAAGWRKSKI